jgi:hypothetical protein
MACFLFTSSQQFALNKNFKANRSELNEHAESRAKLARSRFCDSDLVLTLLPNPDKPEPKKQKRTQRRRDAKLPQSFFLLLFLHRFDL